MSSPPCTWMNYVGLFERKTEIVEMLESLLEDEEAELVELERQLESRRCRGMQRWWLVAVVSDPPCGKQAVLQNPLAWAPVRQAAGARPPPSCAL